MTPQDAAQQFVRLVLRLAFDDVLNLVNPVDNGEHDAHARAQQSAYEEVKGAVRRELGFTHDLAALEEAVPVAAAEEQRGDVESALSDLLMAVADEYLLREHTGYVVGIAIGRALHASVSGDLGGGWRSRR